MIEFISYSGKKPIYCKGQLKVKINDEEVTFGKDQKQNIEGQYPIFWVSGGTCGYDYENKKLEALDGDWIFDDSKIPNKYLDIKEELKQVFKDNVACGCSPCGSCKGH